MGTHKPRFSSEYPISVVKDQYMITYCICLFFSRNSGGVLCCGIILKTIKGTDCTRGVAQQKGKKHCTSRKRTKIIVGLVLNPIQNQHSDGLICLFLWIIYLLKHFSWWFIWYQINWIFSQTRFALADWSSFIWAIYLVGEAKIVCKFVMWKGSSRHPCMLQDYKRVSHSWRAGINK